MLSDVIQWQGRKDTPYYKNKELSQNNLKLIHIQKEKHKNNQITLFDNTVHYIFIDKQCKFH